jgi:hypothetical protein
MRRNQLAALIPLLLVPRLASPQGEPLGPEFRVNTATPFSQGSSSIASIGGDFVVVWEDANASGDSGFGVVGRRFDSGGNPLGMEFRVNTSTYGEQHSPAVGANASGFVVVWQSQILVTPEPFPLYTWSVFGQRYAASGDPVGQEFRVNGPVSSIQDELAVAVAPSGAFLVVWYQAIGQAPPAPGNVVARRFDSSGVPQGPAFLVNSYTPYFQGSGSVAADPAGNFVVVWTSQYQYGSSEVLGRRYDASGPPLGPEFRVNTYTGAAGDPTVATDASGNFTVAWSSDQEGEADFGLFGQRFASSGAPLGPEFHVNTSTTGDQFLPAIAVDGGGHFVIVWFDEPSSGTGDIFGQRYSSLGVPSGAEFRVNTTIGGWQRNPSIASNPNGTFLVTWESGPPFMIPAEVFGQRFGGVFPVKLQDFGVE